MIDADVHFDGHEPSDIIAMFEEFDAVIESELEDAATNIGARFQGAIQRNIEENDQWDTGRMHSSIGFEVEELGTKVIRVVAGTNVFYAEFQEDLYPFLEPAFEEEGDWAMQRYEQAIRNASAEVFGQ
ncbi:HK97 gp10 family phage protein [Natrononativus amylolyticus]|uniref:HK97 gp10 family phage protein n=1 Tax=Natrononativus amylolyticus TaxID=2963434 RepID=UPI0020CEC5A2|nr:HK97 gp10 family phage protein [Natrononativus amylolyticus]